MADDSHNDTALFDDDGEPLFTNAELWEAITASNAAGHVPEAAEVENFPPIMANMGDGSDHRKLDWFRFVDGEWHWQAWTGER